MRHGDITAQKAHPRGQGSGGEGTAGVPGPRPSTPHPQPCSAQPYPVQVELSWGGGEERGSRGAGLRVGEKRAGGVRARRGQREEGSAEEERDPG